MATSTNIISVKDMVKTYHLGEVEVPALRGVSLEIRDCDFLVITGRNGSGKSTLLHQLGLLDRPDSGEILLAGEDITKVPEKRRTALRLRYLGYIFQEFALADELTALENVMLPSMMIHSISISRTRALELLELVGLKGLEKHQPNQLSGGEQQKVAIARSMVNDPVVLFADEPTANLDSVAAAEIMDVFKRLNKEHGRTVVMITHEEEEANLGNRMIKLADGEIVDER
ncbi:MAG TPA: ABC transporter ATP-binding protein [Candidatus Anoxymicrobiaceae bacterium]